MIFEWINEMAWYRLQLRVSHIRVAAARPQALSLADRLTVVATRVALDRGGRSDL
jgi:hypothetical protein